MSAIISTCGSYRYRLERNVADTGPVYAFFGVNPSTADIDDATVRKWKGFVSRWSGSKFIVGNVFAYRATDVRELAHCADPVGRANNDHLHPIAAHGDILVPCWGNISKVPRGLRCHFRGLLKKMAETGKPVLTFGISNAGDPKHPLMLGYDTPLTPHPSPRSNQVDVETLARATSATKFS